MLPALPGLLNIGMLARTLPSLPSNTGPTQPLLYVHGISGYHDDFCPVTTAPNRTNEPSFPPKASLH